MVGPRWLVGLLTVVLLLPLVGPVRSSVTALSPMLGQELPRLVELGQNSLQLWLLTTTFSLPLATVLALLLTRVNIVGRSLLWGLVLLGLFLPLPLVAVAWQVVLGSWLPPLSLAPGVVAWRPWNQGLLPAAWVHAMAALPWLTAWLASTLRSTDQALEDQAALDGGSGPLLRYVLWPRLKLGWLGGVLWLFVQTFTEIAITDAMMVRTWAEEVYTQFVSASDGLGRSMLLTLPFVTLLAGLVLLGSRWLRQLPVNASADLRAPRWLPLSTWQLLAGNGLAWLIGGLALALPLMALVWKAGGADARTPFQLSRLGFELDKVARTDGLIALQSLGVAVAVGLITTGLAWGLIFLARPSRLLQRWLLLLGVVLAVVPGPLVGIGFKDLIQQLILAEHALLNASDITLSFPPFRSMLYDQPSPLPAAWACTWRFLPLALLLAASAFQTIPAQLWDQAAIDGLTWRETWRVLLKPLTGTAAARCVLLVAALTVGEVSASKLVNPPFAPSGILRLFDQMHYGADSTVAALCLLQVGLAFGLAGLWGVLLLDRGPGSRSV